MLPVLGLDNTTFIQRFQSITAMWLSAVEHYVEAEKLGPYQMAGRIISVQRYDWL
jgi:hypothetical protein